jgi:hypothetical protein
MAFRFHATWTPRPGKSVPLVFPTAAKRDAFRAAHPGTAAAVRAKAAPKRAVVNVRTPSEIEARQCPPLPSPSRKYAGSAS